MTSFSAGLHISPLSSILVRHQWNRVPIVSVGLVSAATVWRYCVIQHLLFSGSCCSVQGYRGQEVFRNGWGMNGGECVEVWPRYCIYGKMSIPHHTFMLKGNTTQFRNSCVSLLLWLIYLFSHYLWTLNNTYHSQFILYVLCSSISIVGLISTSLKATVFNKIWNYVDLGLIMESLNFWDRWWLIS